MNYGYELRLSYLIVMAVARLAGLMGRGEGVASAKVN